MGGGDLEEVHQQRRDAVVELPGEDDVTGHDDVHPGQLLQSRLNVLQKIAKEK